MPSRFRARALKSQTSIMPKWRSETIKRVGNDAPLRRSLGLGMAI
jgi:hypothetical protein